MTYSKDKQHFCVLIFGLFLDILWYKNIQNIYFCAEKINDRTILSRGIAKIRSLAVKKYFRAEKEISPCASFLTGRETQQQYICNYKGLLHLVFLESVHEPMQMKFPLSVSSCSILYVYLW